MLDATAGQVYERYENPNHEEEFHRIDIRHVGPLFNWRKYTTKLDAYAAKLERKLAMSGNQNFIEHAARYSREWDEMCIGRGKEKVRHMEEVQSLKNQLADKDREIEKLQYRIELMTKPKNQISMEQPRNYDQTYASASGRTRVQQAELAWLMSLDYGGPTECTEWLYIGNQLDLKPQTARDYARKFWKERSYYIRRHAYHWHVDTEPYQGILAAYGYAGPAAQNTSSYEDDAEGDDE